MVRKIKDGIFEVGSIDWDRRLFDELIPLPDGTSYNSYLIQGSERTVLIDTVDPSKSEELLSNLKSVGVERLDYLIANHAEQDHSGTIPLILDNYPQAKLVVDQKCQDFLVSLLHIPVERCQVVGDGDGLSLGNRSLEFLITPWVHWPETMLTYLVDDRILFSCDLFGSHFAQSELYITDTRRSYLAAKRYYAEIMMPFRSKIRNHLDRVNRLELDIIAPSHGPLYAEPRFILDAYQDWTSEGVKNEVVLPFVSMHGSTRKMVDYFIAALIKRGITVIPFNLTTADLGELAMAIVDAATIVIGTPTVLTGPHPSAIYAAYLVGALRPKTRYVSIIGSYGWGGRMVETIKNLIKNLKAEIIAPVVVTGHPREEDLAKLDQLADEISSRHNRLEA